MQDLAQKFTLILQETSQLFAKQDLERKNMLSYNDFSNIFHCWGFFASSEASGSGHY